MRYFPSLHCMLWAQANFTLIYIELELFVKVKTANGCDLMSNGRVDRLFMMLDELSHKVIDKVSCGL